MFLQMSSEDEKSLLCKGFRFFIPVKKIEYADCFTQFELLYKYTIMFEMKSENSDFLKNKQADKTQSEGLRQESHDM